MWYETLWDIPLYWWLVLVVVGTASILIAFLRSHYKADPIEECMDYYCQCYAKGEINRDDFEGLKKDLQKFERPINSTNRRKPKPHA